MKVIKLRGASAVKVLITIAVLALLYFVVWPFVRDSYISGRYDKMNKGAQDVYEAAEVYIESYGDGAGTRSAPADIIQAKIGKYDGSLPTKSISNQVAKDLGSDFEGCYYTVILDHYGEVLQVYMSSEKDGKIVGGYPQRFYNGTQPFDSLDTAPKSESDVPKS